MTCRVERWRSDPYYGAVAVVKAGDGYVVGDISGWILGAFQKYVEVPPGLYRLEDGDCVVEPPRYPWHFPTPYIAADWGDVVELRIYAPETPEVSGGEVTKLADVGPFAVYLGTTRRRRYEVRCCGKTRRFQSPPAASSPPVTAMYEVLPDRAADRLGYRDLRLNTGPAWAEAKDSSLMIHVAGTRIAIENKRAVFSNTYQSLELPYK